MSSSTGLLNPYISAAEIPEVPVVETTSTSTASLPAVADAPQLFEPVESECGALATIGDVMRWAGFPSGPSNAAVCERQSFLLVFGAKETDHVRVLANLPANQFDESLQDWKFDGASPARGSKGELVGRACRIATGTEGECQSSAAMRTSCSSSSCVSSVIWHAPPRHRQPRLRRHLQRILERSVARSPRLWRTRRVSGGGA